MTNDEKRACLIGDAGGDDRRGATVGTVDNVEDVEDLVALGDDGGGGRRNQSCRSWFFWFGNNVGVHRSSLTKGS